MLLKTTLSNTRITKYNSVVFTYNSSELIDQDNIILNCFNCSIGKFIYGLKNNEINEDEIGLLHNFSLLEQYEIKKPESLSPKWDEINRNKLNEYNEELIKVLNDNKTIINENIFLDSNVKSKYQSKILYYECIDKSKLPKNTHENSLKKIIHGTTIVTLLLLIILYYYYSFNFNIDQNAYFSNIKNIQSFTLVLKDISVNENYYKELNDLIFHINKIFGNYEDFNIFDITISNVNEEKKNSFQTIKQINKSIDDIKADNDTLLKKIKSIFSSKKNSDIIDEKSELLIDNTNEKSIKIENFKKDLEKELLILSEDINQLNYWKYNYTDIFITFKSNSKARYIFNKYNDFFELFCINICCKQDKYLYKNKMLKLDFPISSPDNIKWENHYFANRAKRKCYSFLFSFIIIIVTTIAFRLINLIECEKLITNLIIIIISKAINILSIQFLKKMTEYEKNDNLTEDISSEINKELILQFIISGISINFCFFTYKDFEQYSEVISCILMSMLISIGSDHATSLLPFIWTNIKRFKDSRFENGIVTKVKTKAEYINLYVGPEFPIGQRYGSILVNFIICLLYGTYCPLIYLFFTIYLISIFIIDKFLLLCYYKKPIGYDDYLSKFLKTYLFFAIFIYFNGVIYHLSNPYLFNYYQNTSTFIRVSDINYYNIINPFSLIYRLIGTSDKYVSIIIFNYSNLGLPYIIIFSILFILPNYLYFNLKLIFLNNKKHYLHFENSDFDVSNLYSFEQLEKYYEIKKLELFKLLYNIRKNKEMIKDYSELIQNYKDTIDYLKKKIEKRDKNLITIRQFQTDISSYNFAFNPEYEIYKYSELLYNF